MKKFHKTVTPPPRTAFMKSLFRNLAVFLVHMYFWIRDMKSGWPPPPVCEKFHKIPIFLGDGFPYLPTVLDLESSRPNQTITIHNFDKI